VRELEPHAIVLLRYADARPDLPEERLAELQEAHIAFLDQQRATGAMLAAGPFRDRVDENLRGLCVYALPLEDVRRIAVDDPFVVAGVFRADVFTWMTPPGQARFGPQ